MKSEKLKRNFWLTAEIECMLNLIKEIKTQGSSSAMTTYCTFTQIANKMKKRGFPNKSPTQIRRKWFQMKSAYLCYKKGNVERLFLIPEKFRTVIAQFVESGNKIGRPSLPLNKPKQESNSPKAPPPPPPKETSPLEKFVAQVRHNNSLLNDEFNRLQESLLQYEQKCQSVRDYNIMKFISI